MYTIPRSFADNMNGCHEIENHHPISIPGIEGIRIPSGSHGYIIKILEEDAALVRWEVKIFFILLKCSYFIVCLPIFTLHFFYAFLFLCQLNSMITMTFYLLLCSVMCH